MTSGFDITESSSAITVATESLTLVFDKDRVGITSFKYETSGTWHECVESGTSPPILFGPYFAAPSIEGGVLSPAAGSLLKLERSLPWYVQIYQIGYLRNASIPEESAYHYYVRWGLWSSGRLYCRMECLNTSFQDVQLTEEAYRLNPADDPDITLGRDTAPNLDWFGFHSNNTGSGESDLSHDAIVVPYGSVLDQYGTDGNTNRIYRSGVTFGASQSFIREFLVALSVSGSWGDVTSAQGFESRGDALSADYRNPDPLDGSQDAGDVVVGSLVGDGFDEALGGYTAEPA